MIHKTVKNTQMYQENYFKTRIIIDMAAIFKKNLYSFLEFKNI